MQNGRAVVGSLAAALAVTGLALVLPALSRPAAAATLTQVTSFGGNPGNMQMHIYVPNNRPARPAIVVAMHGCGGSGPGFYSGSEFASLADRYGFIVIYPTATQSAGFGNCFDTWSAAAKVRNGGSDPVSLYNMILYTERTYNGDPNRVFATGSSSGGMMTQHMLALYPDVFVAGASFMGVPFGCFANAADYPPGSSQCTGGTMNRTPQQWGDLVRAAYPGYAGSRPPVQLWHGTADTLVPYSLLQEGVEQWTNVSGLSQTPTSTDSPQPGWTRQRFAGSTGVKVEAISVSGAGHSLPQAGMAAYAVAFFGITGTPPTTAPPTTAPPTTAPPTTAPPTTTPPTTTPPTGQPGTCTAGYRLVSSWPGGFQGEVTVTSTATVTLSGWTVRMTMAGGQSITNLWNGVNTGSTGAVSVRNAPYNGAIPPRGSTTFGFTANGGSTPAPGNLSCTSP